MNVAESKSISLYTQEWDVLEKKAKQLRLDRSGYIRLLVNKDDKKINRSSIVYVGLYLLLALTIVLIVLR